jgi:hypothetical protein
MTPFVGFSLAQFGVSEFLADPKLQVFWLATPVANDDDWSTQEPMVSAWTARTGAFAFSSGSKDAALPLTLSQVPTNYTVQVTSADGISTGETLVEMYEVMDAGEALNGRRLVNISTRGMVTPTAGLTAGFVIQGNVPRRVLIRGVGRTLRNYGIQKYLLDPRIDLYRQGQWVAGNDNWADTDGAEVTYASAQGGAFTLVDSTDAGLVINLDSGSYTAVLSSADGSTGVGMVEVYEVK